MEKNAEILQELAIYFLGQQQSRFSLYFFQADF